MVSGWPKWPDPVVSGWPQPVVSGWPKWPDPCPKASFLWLARVSVYFRDSRDSRDLLRKKKEIFIYKRPQVAQVVGVARSAWAHMKAIAAPPSTRAGLRTFPKPPERYFLSRGEGTAGARTVQEQKAICSDHCSLVK